MTTVGVRDLKNQLSRFVALVKRGERVVVTEHGVPVAVLGPIDSQSKQSLSYEQKLAKMEAEGLMVVRDHSPFRAKKPTVVNRGGRLASDIINDDRR